MNDLSPRGSFVGPSSDEVAEDFKDNLGDLEFNDKFRIQNLTLIAKESTEHAQAISRVLETHIKTTPPNKKLPALYVLDSIIKNVGTPYTVYLGRNLYLTFMEMYGLVDQQTRRAMEAVLRTWKDPLAESTDRRPVLPPDLVKPIEQALLKAKAAISQHQQQPSVRYGTPQQMGNLYAQPNQPQQIPFQQPYQQQYIRPISQTGYHQPQAQPMPDLESVKRDLHFVLQSLSVEAQRHPYDPVLGGRLKALHDLNMVLHQFPPSPSDLQIIAAQIREQMAQLPRNEALQQWQQPPTPQMPQFVMPQSQPPVSIPPQQLNSLAALFGNGPKPSTPQMRAAAPSLSGLPLPQVQAIQNQAAAAPPSNGADLFAALSKAGIMKSPVPATVRPDTMPVTSLQPGLADLLKSLNQKPGQKNSPSIDLTSRASLDTFRPELVRKLYPEHSDPCPQCGRRFATTVEERRKKDMHLDWHFRINQRIASNALGRHRNWYSNDIEWVKRREFDESTAIASDVTQADAVNAGKPNEAKLPYVRAPAGVTKVTCNICYEEMRSSFPEEIGDWVFMNAAVNNGKIVHATCLAELQGTPAVSTVSPIKGGNTVQPSASLAAALAALGGNINRESSRTPDSSLGKRKAEEDVGGPGKIFRGI